METTSVLQSSFATGVVSEAILARIDLDKFKGALARGENFQIKPYGAAFKRQGTIFRGYAKAGVNKYLLRKFYYNDSYSYMLEIGAGYIRVHLLGEFLEIEIATQYLESDLDNLRFTQSIDVMYIASGRLPLKTLSRYSPTDWRFEDAPIKIMSFKRVNSDSALVITTSNVAGTITLTSNGNVFDPAMEGTQIKIIHELGTRSVNLNANESNSTVYSPAVLVGSSWAFITSGNWGGTFSLQESTDGAAWTAIRSFSSENNFNANVTGTVDKPVYMRIASNGWTSNGGKSSLTAYAYTHEGIVQITAVISATSATATIVERLGSTAATSLWSYGEWSAYSGYPRCVSFFQDRLALAGSSSKPNGVWFSKSSSYTDFGVDSTNGNVTDDSGINISVISRELFDIRHILPTQDFVIFTSGNEWMLSGQTVIKPTDINPRMQTGWGCGYLEPEFIGNRIVYIQRRGSKIRDSGYSFESDSYDSEDLTIYVPHLTNRYTFVDSTYWQDPYSIIYFVRDDGQMLSLTYLREQNVYAWTNLVTDGKYKNVLSVPEGDKDTVYVIVERKIKGELLCCIEQIAQDPETQNIADYVMSDCASIVEFDQPSDGIEGLHQLAGQKVHVVGDDQPFPVGEYTVSTNGNLSVPYACSKFIIGRPYTAYLELPPIVVADASAQNQFKKKSVKKCFLKLDKSFGGKAYAVDVNGNSQIIKGLLGGGYAAKDDLAIPLRTVIEEVIPPIATTREGRIGIMHEEPYPFTIAGVTREVVT